eukprot:Clim_evm147s210 gene=Clim_evmTU147s210
MENYLAEGLPQMVAAFCSDTSLQHTVTRSEIDSAKGQPALTALTASLFGCTEYEVLWQFGEFWVENMYRGPIRHGVKELPKRRVQSLATALTVLLHVHSSIHERRGDSGQFSLPTLEVSRTSAVSTAGEHSLELVVREIDAEMLPFMEGIVRGTARLVGYDTDHVTVDTVPNAEETDSFIMTVLLVKGDDEDTVPHMSVRESLPPIALDQNFVDRVFPFHFILGSNLEIVQIGSFLHNVCQHIKVGDDFRKHLWLKSPQIDSASLGLDVFEIHKNRTFVFEVMGIVLSGQITLIQNGTLALFMGSPDPDSLRDYMRLRHTYRVNNGIYDAAITGGDNAEESGGEERGSDSSTLYRLENMSFFRMPPLSRKPILHQATAVEPKHGSIATETSATAKPYSQATRSTAMAAAVPKFNGKRHVHDDEGTDTESAESVVDSDSPISMLPTATELSNCQDIVDEAMALCNNQQGSPITITRTSSDSAAKQLETADDDKPRNPIPLTNYSNSTVDLRPPIQKIRDRLSAIATEVEDERIRAQLDIVMAELTHNDDVYLPILQVQRAKDGKSLTVSSATPEGLVPSQPSFDNGTQGNVADVGELNEYMKSFFPPTLPDSATVEGAREGRRESVVSLGVTSVTSGHSDDEMEEFNGKRLWSKAPVERSDSLGLSQSNGAGTETDTIEVASPVTVSSSSPVGSSLSLPQHSGFLTILTPEHKEEGAQIVYSPVWTQYFCTMTADSTLHIYVSEGGGDEGVSEVAAFGENEDEERYGKLTDIKMKQFSLQRLAIKDGVFCIEMVNTNSPEGTGSLFLAARKPNRTLRWYRVIGRICSALSGGRHKCVRQPVPRMLGADLSKVFVPTSMARIEGRRSPFARCRRTTDNVANVSLHFSTMLLEERRERGLSTTEDGEDGEIEDGMVESEGSDKNCAQDVMRASDINRLDFDLWTLSEVLCQYPLQYLTMQCIQAYDLCNKLKINERSMLNFLFVIESGYRASNPYHNSIHAADVVQTMFYFLRTLKLDQHFNDEDILASLLAAAVHDYGHPGVNNAYLVAFEDDLALCYNDKSVLENMHVSKALTILKQPDCDVFANFSEQQFKRIRLLMIEMILNTDMAYHFELMGKFSGVSTTLSEPNLPAKDHQASLRLIMSMALHCADVSNPAKPESLYVEWAYRVMEEFFRQGESELANGLPISPFYERATKNIPKCQTGFINFIVKPLFELFAKFLPGLHDECLPNLEDSLQMWARKELPEAKWYRGMVAHDTREKDEAAVNEESA